MPLETFQNNLERNTRNYIDDLRVLVRRQPLNELLSLLSSFLWPNELAWEDLRRRTRGNEQTLTKIKVFIPFLAKFAINQSNDHVGTSNRNINDFYADLERSINLIIEIKDWLPYDLFDDPDYAFSAWQFVIANQQFPLQENPKNYLIRCLLFYKTIPAEINSQLNIAEAFQNIFGLSIERFWLLVIKTLQGYHGAWFPTNIYLGLNEPPYNITAEELTTYFNKISTDYTTFRTISIDQSVSLVGRSTQFYGFTPFDKFPVIRNGSQSLILSPYYLVKRLTHSVYFDLLHYFQVGDDLRNNPFSSEFGMIFQNYIGKQLSYIDDGSELIPEFEYDSDNKKFADWSLLYTNKLVLFEVKKNLLPNSIKFMMYKNELKESLEKGIIKGLRQCYNKINHSRNNISGLERFSNVEEFYPVVIIYDDTYLFNDNFIRTIIDETLSEEGIAFDKKWQIITTREIEDVVNICSAERSFISLLSEKLDSSDKLLIDWTQYLKSKNIDIGENALLRETFETEIELLNTNAAI